MRVSILGSILSSQVHLNPLSSITPPKSLLSSPTLCEALPPRAHLPRRGRTDVSPTGRGIDAFRGYQKPTSMAKGVLPHDSGHTSLAHLSATAFASHAFWQTGGRWQWVGLRGEVGSPVHV